MRSSVRVTKGKRGDHCPKTLDILENLKREGVVPDVVMDIGSHEAEKHWKDAVEGRWAYENENESGDPVVYMLYNGKFIALAVNPDSERIHGMVHTLRQYDPDPPV
jgi:hypothetical protein